MASDAKSVDQLNNESAIAADFLSGFLAVTGISGDVKRAIHDFHPLVRIMSDTGSSLDALVGAQGQVLDALQYLSRLAVKRKTGEFTKLIVDIDGFMARKMKSLRNKTFRAIDVVKHTGMAVKLEPMNSFDRKIIHDTARAEGFSSQSFGNEPYRYVKLFASAPQVSVDDHDQQAAEDNNSDPTGDGRDYGSTASDVSHLEGSHPAPSLKVRTISPFISPTTRSAVDVFQSSDSSVRLTKPVTNKE